MDTTIKDCQSIVLTDISKGSKLCIVEEQCQLVEGGVRDEAIPNLLCAVSTEI